MFKVNLALATVLCIVLFSCNFEESWKFWKEPSPVIAEVENSRLYINELKESRSDSDNISKEEWILRIETWVNSEVMYREAIKRGLQKDPETQRLIKNAEKKILVDRLRLTIDSLVDIESDKELQDFYDNHKTLFVLDTVDSSVSYAPFAEVKPQIRSAVLSRKRIKKESVWLIEAKNNYSIEVYPKFLDSL